MLRCVGAPRRDFRLRRLRESGCTRRPVVTISSATEESEDDEGWDEISTQESSKTHQYEVVEDREATGAPRQREDIALTVIS